MLAVRLHQEDQQLQAFYRVLAAKAEGYEIPPWILNSIIVANSSEPDTAWCMFEEAHRICGSGSKAHRMCLLNAIARVAAVHGHWRRLRNIVNLHIRVAGRSKRTTQMNLFFIDYVFRGYIFAGRPDLAFEYLLAPVTKRAIRDKKTIHTLAYAIHYLGSAHNDHNLVQELAYLYNEVLSTDEERGGISTKNLNLFLEDFLLVTDSPWMYEKLQRLEQRLYRSQATTVEFNSIGSITKFSIK